MLLVDGDGERTAVWLDTLGGEIELGWVSFHFDAFDVEMAERWWSAFAPMASMACSMGRLTRNETAVT